MTRECAAVRDPRVRGKGRRASKRRPKWEEVRRAARPEATVPTGSGRSKGRTGGRQAELGKDVGEAWDRGLGAGPGRQDPSYLEGFQPVALGGAGVHHDRHGFH